MPEITSETTASRLKAIDLGHMAYGPALAKQFEHFNAVLHPDKEHEEFVDGCLLIAEHPPTITLGKSEQGENLIAAEELLQKRQVECFTVGRGGKTTFHGPGQILLYPIMPLRRWRLRVKSFVCKLEKVMAETCSHYGIAAEGGSANSKPAGCWVEERKIGQVGIALSRGISRHGVAFNVHTDLSYFELIRPCGLDASEVTHLHRELQRDNVDELPALADVKQTLVDNFAKVFALSLSF